jgi:RNA recognition motif-containing protein
VAAISLFLTNLPFDWDENALKKQIAPYVEVLKIDIVRDPLTQRSHGSAIIQAKDEAEAEKFIKKFHRQVIQGRMLSVKKI